MRIRRQIAVRGVVQGVGFRPFVHGHVAKPVDPGDLLAIVSRLVPGRVSR